MEIKGTSRSGGTSQGTSGNGGASTQVGVLVEVEVLVGNTSGSGGCQMIAISTCTSMLPSLNPDSTTLFASNFN